MKTLLRNLRSRIEKSIIKEMIALLTVALVLSGALFTFLYLSIHQLHLLRQLHVNYEKGRKEALFDLQEYAELLQYASDDEYKTALAKIHDYIDGEVYVVLEDGTVCSNGDAVYQLDLKKWKQRNTKLEDEDKFFAYYPFSRQGNLYYVLQNKDLTKTYTYTDEWMLLTAGVISVIFYFILVFSMISKKITYIKKIGISVDSIKLGNLNTNVVLEGNDELFRIADSINEMQCNLSSLIKKEKEDSMKKYELITGMAHDIKTPITIILGYLDIIIHGKYKSEEERQSYMKKTYEKAESLRKMIQTLFDMTKSENQANEQNRTYISFDRMLRQAVSEYEPLAEEKNIGVQANIADIPQLYLDGDQMLTVIHNVLGNALKYCKPSGLIHINLYQVADDTLFTIANSSEEMNDQDLSQIFDEFYRMDKSRNSSVEGSGLGLYLVKKIVQTSHGTVWAEYKDGMFSITIRLR